jgi:hypothetical protein
MAPARARRIVGSPIGLKCRQGLDIDTAGGVVATSCAKTG